MPGITGFIVPEQPQQGVLDDMLGTMLHEPFYTSGTLVEPELGLGIGWTCHPGSYCDCLPVWNELKDVCLVFCGEHAADPSESDRLRNASHDFTERDARMLVHLYEEDEEAFFPRLNGIFSGLLLDLRKHEAILFNDRYGLGRLYFHQNDRGFYFASEAKALLKVLPQLRQLDEQGLAEYFACGTVIQDRSLFKGVSLVPPASAWGFGRDRSVRKKRYFRHEEWEEQEALPPDEYYGLLRQKFAQVLDRYFSGDLPVALSLTGGLDTRMIVAWARNEPFSLPCYTFGGMYRDAEDVRISRRVAGVCRQRHEVIRVDRDVFGAFPDLAERSVYITDGSMDVTGGIGLFTNGRAREIAPVRLTGNYGSEVLRSNVAFKVSLPSLSAFSEGFLPQLERAEKTFAGESDMGDRPFIVFKQLPWHHYNRWSLEQSQLTVRSPYLDNELVALAFSAPDSLATNQELTHRLIEEGSPALALIPTDFGLLGPPNRFLRNLRKLYQGFIHRADYAFDYGMPQSVARIDGRLSGLHLEKLFLGRHKYAHFRIWYRNELSQYVKDVLLDDRSLSRNYLNKNEVERMVTDHLEGRGNYTSEITVLLSAELLQRKLIEAR